MALIDILLAKNVATGPQGQRGLQGIAGIAGTAGTQGPAGTMPPVTVNNLQTGAIISGTLSNIDISEDASQVTYTLHDGQAPRTSVAFHDTSR